MRDPLVETKQGKIRGVHEEGCIVFKGIRYAHPTGGENRFRAPRKVVPWDGIYEADHFGNRSAQVQWLDGGLYEKEFYQDPVYRTPVSEDGLFLNIWIPDREVPEPMPVAFYIHGGGFNSGCGHEIEFRTQAYAKKDVILVTINYRLGIFGYLATRELAAEDPAAVGNYGILDQIAALNWVQENIAAFGGDPHNVTIYGQSAGCGSVQALLSTPYARGGGSSRRRSCRAGPRIRHFSERRRRLKKRLAMDSW